MTSENALQIWLSEWTVIQLTHNIWSGDSWKQAVCYNKYIIIKYLNIVLVKKLPQRPPSPGDQFLRARRGCSWRYRYIFTYAVFFFFFFFGPGKCVTNGGIIFIAPEGDVAGWRCASPSPISAGFAELHIFGFINVKNKVVDCHSKDHKPEIREVLFTHSQHPAIYFLLRCRGWLAFRGIAPRHVLQVQRAWRWALRVGRCLRRCDVSALGARDDVHVSASIVCTAEIVWKK